MALHFGTDRNKKKKKIVGQLRRAQLVTTFGSGAIVDMPQYSVVMAATDYWKDRSPILHERNLEKLLKVSHFRQPYVSENPDEEFSPDVPAFRFPIMHFCPDCKRLMPYWGFGDVDGRKCKKCNKNIVPSRFIAACINGHLEDFPYRWWVHRGDFSECSYEDTRKNDKLTISFSEESGGLESIIIKCTHCGKTRSMAGSLSREALSGYHCIGRRPWIGLKQDSNDPEECRAPMRGLQRGASNVYFAMTANALTIPPWSARINQEIEQRWEALSSLLDSNPEESNLKSMLEFAFYDLIRTGHYSIEDIVQEVLRYRERQEGTEEYTSQDLIEDEYRVFMMKNYARDDDLQFRIESTVVPGFLERFIDEVILVRRLREVLALRGFRRITPGKNTDDDPNYRGYNLEGDCAPLSKNPQNWYPGIEMLGEGIFIQLNEGAVSAWESEFGDRYSAMRSRLEKSNMTCPNMSARYVLLHTLSHLLIKQLSIECGYSGASVKERIYSTFPDSDYKMAGILIYTSSSDSDGSLGGLVRNGLPEPFERIFRNMLQEASWCSGDPVCIESMAQGYNSLNYAACYACTLLPETSCEMRNCLLDRGAVVGSITDRDRGFFGQLLEEVIQNG